MASTHLWSLNCGEGGERGTLLIRAAYANYLMYSQMCLGDQREAGAGFTLRVRSFYSGNLPQRDLFICPHLVAGKSLVNYRRSALEELKPPSIVEAPEGNDPGCAAAQASPFTLCGSARARWMPDPES